MISTDREKFYDTEVAPKLKELADACGVNGLSFLAVVEWAPDEYGRTLMLQPDRGLGIRLADLAARTKGNVDLMIMGFIRYAKEHGHSSAYMSILGIPTTPGAPKP